MKQLVFNLTTVAVTMMVFVFVGFINTPTALAQGPIDGDVIGQFGGTTDAVAVSGNQAYIGIGPRLAVVDVTNSASPSLVGQLSQPLPCVIRDIKLSSNYAYVTGKCGLFIIDVSIPATLRLVGHYETEGDVAALFVKNNLAYLAMGSSDYSDSSVQKGLWLVDVSNPTHPTLKGQLSLIHDAHDVYVSGNVAYLATSGGLYTVYVNLPTSPKQLGYASTYRATGVFVIGGNAYLVTDYELQIFNVSTPATPTLSGGFGLDYNYNRKAIVDSSYAYIADDSGLLSVNLTNVFSPTAGNFYQASGRVNDVVISGGRAFLAAGDSLQIVDVSNPATTAMASRTPVSNIQDVVVNGSYAYASTYFDIQVFNITNSTSPTLAAIFNDEGGGDVELSGNYLYQCSGSNLVVMSIINPTSPTLVSNNSAAPSYTYACHIVGQYGYLATSSGLQIINLSNPLSPTLIGSYGTNYSYSVYKAGSYVYMGSYDGNGHNLLILDVSNPAAPALVGSYPSYFSNIQVSGNYLYATGGGSLSIINVSNPTNPTLAGYYPGDFSSVQVANNKAYLGADSRIMVVDVSNPTNPTLVGGYFTGGYFSSKLHITGTQLYVANYSTNELQIFDANPPLLLPKLGEFRTLGDWFTNIEVEGNIAYTLITRTSAVSYVAMIDVSNPTIPTVVGGYDSEQNIINIHVRGAYLYLLTIDMSYDNWNPSSYSLQVVNVSNPAAPVLVGSSPPVPGHNVYYGFDFYISNSYVYIVSDSGLDIIDVSNPATPTVVKQLNISKGARSIYVRNGYAYVMTGDGNLMVIDVSDPDAIIVIDTYSSGVTCCNYYYSVIPFMQVSGDYLYLGDIMLNGLLIFNLNNPISPTLISHYSNLSFNQITYIDNGYVYMVGSNSPWESSNIIQKVDVSNPANPTFVISETLHDMVNGIYVKGDMIYLTGEAGLQIRTLSTSLITSVSPNSAVANAGNVPVTISGLNFQSPLTLTLDDVALLTTTMESSTTLRAVVPVGSLAQGNYTLTLTSTGQVISLTNAFTVTAPVEETQVRVMVYLACDNNLNEACFDIIEQAELAMTQNPDLRIVMLYDGNGANDSAYLNIHPSNGGRFDLAKYWSYTDTVKLEEVNTASPETLIKFANWAASQYPGRYKLLSLVGHGAGWSPQIYLDQRRPHGAPGPLVDDHSPESDLSTTELAEALNAMTTAAPLDVLYLDNCLMGSVEIASELSPYSRYLIAHENLTWTFYPYQDYFGFINRQTQPLDLANHIAQVYINKVTYRNTPYSAQISVIDTQAMPQVETALDNLAHQLKPIIATHQTEISQAMLRVIRVDENGNYTVSVTDTYVDLHDLTKQLDIPALPDNVRGAAVKLRNTIPLAVVTNFTQTGYPYYSTGELYGLSIYFPLQDQCERPFYTTDSLPHFASRTQWDDFIQSWYKGSIPPYSPDGCRNSVLPLPPPPGLFLTLGLSPTMKANNNLLLVPVVLNNALTRDDVRGLVIQVSSSDVTRLKPDCSQAAKLGSFVPSGALANPTCTADGWLYPLNLLPTMPAFSGTGTLFYLPFRTSGITGEVMLTFKQHQVVNGQVKSVTHQAISATTQILPNVITGTASLQYRSMGLYGGVLITVSNGLDLFTTTTDINGNYTIPLISTGKITFTHGLYVKRVVSFNSDPTPLNVCLWAGDLDGTNSVTYRDWLILSGAVFPVNNLAYDINGDGVTDGLDLMILTNNVGRLNMTSSNCPMSANNRQLTPPSQTITPVPTQATLTMTVQADNQVALQVIGVKEPLAAIGSRLKLPVGMTITNVELQNDFVGGFLNWHQEGDVLYLVALTPENKPMTQAGDVAVVLTAQGDAHQIRLEASNVTAMPKLTWQTYLPLIIR